MRRAVDEVVEGHKLWATKRRLLHSGTSHYSRKSEVKCAKKNPNQKMKVYLVIEEKPHFAPHICLHYHFSS
jgi:hypothetical protein